MSDQFNLKEVSSGLHADWLQLVIRDCELEAKEFGQMRLIREGARSTLWNLCQSIGYDINGIPGQTCAILERYLYIIYLNSLLFGTSEPARPVTDRDAEEQSLILLSACMLIAAKFNSAGTLNTSANTIQLRLFCRGIILKLDDIVATELDICEKLNFRLPLWNTLDTAYFLATVMKIDTDKMKKLPLIVDNSEFKKVAIQYEVQSKRFLALQFKTGNIRSLHLAAGSVVASLRLCGAPDESARMAQLIHVPAVYILVLRDAILKYFINNPPLHQPSILKKRFRPLFF